MSTEVIFAILAVALVLLSLSAFSSTRYILWESVLHPFRKDRRSDDEAEAIARDSVGRDPGRALAQPPARRTKKESEKEIEDQPPRHAGIG
jgi:hypothetical protein